MRFEWDSKREFCSIGEILIKEAFSDTIFRYNFFLFYVSQLWWKFTGMENLAICLFLLFIYFFLCCLPFPNYKFLSFYFILFFPPSWDYFNIYFFFFVSFSVLELYFLHKVKMQTNAKVLWSGKMYGEQREKKELKTVEISGNLEVEFFFFFLYI